MANDNEALHPPPAFLESLGKQITLTAANTPTPLLVPSGARSVFRLSTNSGLSPIFYGPDTDMTHAFGIISGLSPVEHCYCEWGNMVKGSIFVWSPLGTETIVAIETLRTR